MKNIFNSLLLLMLSVSIISCSKEDSPSETPKDTAKTYAELKAEANTSLENVMLQMSSQNITDPVQLGNFDFETPKKLYEALALQNASDPDVKVSLGLCQMLSLYADPVFKSYLNDMKANGLISTSGDVPKLSVSFLPFNMMSVVSQEVIVNSVLLMIKKGYEDPTGTETLQTYFRTTLIPKLTLAIENFEYAEKISAPGSEYQYALTGKMMGNSSFPNQYMDNTEFYLMDSYLEYLKANLSLYAIIDFKNSDLTEIPADSLNTDDVNAILVLISGKLKTYSYADQYAQSFSDNLTASLTDILNSLKYLQTETDNQNDDVIKKNPNLTAAEINGLITQLEEAQALVQAFLDEWIPVLLSNLPPDFPEF